MDSIKKVFCAECGLVSLLPDSNDYHNAEKLWNRLLIVDPDENDERTAIIEKGIPYYDERKYRPILNENDNLVKKYKEFYNSFSGTSGRNYLGLPVTIKHKTEELGNNKYQGVVIGVINKDDYDEYNMCKVIGNSDHICPRCRKQTVFFASRYNTGDYFLKQADNYIQTIKTSTSRITEDKEFDRSKSDKVDIKAYLKYLIDISSSIFFLEKKIKDDYSACSHFRREINRIIAEGQNDPEIEEKKKEYLRSFTEQLEKKNKELKELLEYSQDRIRELCETNGLNWLTKPVQPQEPKKPEIPQYLIIESSKLNVPSAPVFKKPGLFNKERVTKENQLAQDIYRNQMKEYELERSKELQNASIKAEYEKKVEEYEIKKREYDEEIIKYSAKLTDYESKYNSFEKRKFEIIENDRQVKKVRVSVIQTEIDDLEKKIKEAEVKMETEAFWSELLINNEKYQRATFYTTFFDDEIKELSEELVKQYDVLNRLLEPEIIFPKYNDIVAWNTFYEYFVTGRVEALSGANGAYNLYENEVRANIIIAKIDEIIERLEQIKENQYMLYSMVEKTNNEIGELNEKMKNVLSLQKESFETNKNSKQLLSNIYKTEQGISYSAKKIEKYTEMTAKATKAIAFMKAIWG